MRLDVLHLREFYETQLGAMTQRHVQGVLRALWPNLQGQSLAGYGYPTPFLRPYLPQGQSGVERVAALMPAHQGAVHWPREGGNLCVLVEEGGWPFSNGFFDRILLAHALELCENPAALLGEVWRALAPGGRLIAVVSNRTGLWARRETTPFAFGRPFSAEQLENLLIEAGFTPHRRAAALYAPPSHRRFWLRASTPLERAGARIGAERLAGLRVVEAVKEIYALPRGGAREAAAAPWRWRPATAPRPGLAAASEPSPESGPESGAVRRKDAQDGPLKGS
ncbi:methyltransferase domain-containing protein [Neomegalonema sp.]|uniref:class I SAM-dependent methyltransferase n=1 Tax=Neomegalonema sp. TaxID=2039713 RepID=UPI00262455D9|nr:methyltransferase domain-containing protein [Neomegalonema sp.]MDD2867204.1 methyltransferase domain-containing protein [Neomegalonema sp.]